MTGNVALPWWKALELREEILSSSGTVNDVQMSLYRVAFDRSANRPQYGKPEYYGQITHPTSQLTDLLARIAIRLGAPVADDGDAVIRLGQSMGGGKSHACIGAYHLAKSPKEFAQTDIGRAVLQEVHDRIGVKLPADLRNPHVVVLSCDSMTPGVSVAEQDGPVAQTLYERFLYRLVGGGQTYDAYAPSFSSKADISKAIESVGKPVLIIIDELLNYIGQGLDGAGPKHPGLIDQDMAFLRALTEAVKITQGAAMLVVMISSEQDATALSKEGERRRTQLEFDLRRNGVTRSVTEAADFAAILRRRLFTKEPDQQTVVAAVDAFAATLTEKTWRSKVFEQINAAWTSNFREHVERCYPFHPQLMALAEQEWANLAGFQKVRSTIKIFAATVYALKQRAAVEDSVPLLIGLGDLPLSDNVSREALLDSGLISDAKAQANYRSLAHNDIIDLTGTSGAARTLDSKRKPSLWTEVNPRAAERAATAIFITSVVGLRPQNRQGATDIEVEAALAVPNVDLFSVSDAEGVLRELTDDKDGMTTVEVTPGRGGQKPRYYMKTGLRLPMLVRTMRNTITEDERDELVANRIDSLIRKGTFLKAAFLVKKPGKSRRELLADFMANFDLPRTTRLVVLDPAAFTMQNGEEEATKDAIKAVFGLAPYPIPARWASSVVFAVASTRSRGQMRQFAADYLAYERVVDTTEGQEDAGDIPMLATQERDTAEDNLKAAILRGFQHVLFLVQPGPTRSCETLQLKPNTQKTQSALRGDDIWAELVLHEKAFERRTFTGHVLVHHLRDQDYDKPLSEVRNAFWNTPRLPLLPEGDSELKQAIYEAVKAGTLRLTLGSGEDVGVITAPSDIALDNDGLRLQRPLPSKPFTPDSGSGEQKGESKPGNDTDDVTETSGSDSQDESDGQEDGKGSDDNPASSMEKRLGLIINQDLKNDQDRAAELGAFFREIWVALDKGDASQIAAQIQLMITEDVAQTLAEKGKGLGITVTVTER